MAAEAEQQLRAYVDYLRDLGVYDLYRRGEPDLEAEPLVLPRIEAAVTTSAFG